MDLEAAVRFVRARRQIRAALQKDGVAGKIEDLVAKLLN